MDRLEGSSDDDPHRVCGGLRSSDPCRRAAGVRGTDPGDDQMTSDITSCLLCGRPPTFLGFWLPTEVITRRLGAPPGKHRVVTYSLCQRCKDRRGSLRRVEAKILGEVEVLAGVPECN